MMEIAVTIAAKVTEYLVAPIGRPFGYLFNYRSNIDGLRQQVEKLGDVRARLERSVDEAIRNGDEIEPDVNKWLLSVGGFLEEAAKFFEVEKKANQSCFNGSCSNLKSRYQISREAKKRARVVVEIQGDGKFERVSYRAPLPGIGSTPLKGHEALESRMTTLDEIMEALRDAHVNIIGVWGMAGVGKTTLVKQVAKQAEEEKLFDRVVMAFVSATPELKKIQGELADMVGLKFEEESEMGRAARLRARLKKENKILVILDDVWTELDLEKVGIPFGDDHKGCKMVFTSRNKHVLSNEMGTQKDFPVEHLQEEEALVLFKKMAGDSIEEPDLQSIAIDVAKECAGLPIAIVTVAKALKNKGLSIWEDALQQLKRSTPTNIKGMDAMVYSTLELSYKHLEGDEVKSLFLLSGLMSNEIYIDDLLKYGMGLRLFQRTNTLEEAKNRIDTLVGSLKASKLLLDTGHNSFVRMHDVVRDVAIAIVSKVHHVFSLREDELAEWPTVDELQTCTKISLAYNDICELPQVLVCPELEIFLFYHTINHFLEIPDTFFEGMTKLKVLDLSNMHFISLPSSLHCLTNLRTLSLNWCKLGDISIIVKLKKLEFLSFMGSNIEKLPREIAHLTHLRLFDLRDCSKLREIPPNVLSSLSKLENLCMENSFSQWEVEGKRNACLAELNYLSHLTTLDIQIPDAKLLQKEVLFEKLIRYRIFIGDVWSWDKNCPTTKTLKLNKLDASLHLVDGISFLLKGAKDLHLRELSGAANVLPKLDREGLLQLKHLHVERSPEMQHIMNSMDPILSPCAFPVLESLFLNRLINLQEVCHGQLLAGSFSYLRIVKVECCDGLKFLFSMSMATALSRLEKIEITRCKNISKMVAQGKEEIEGEDSVNVILFPQLRYLTLQSLPKLRNFCLKGKTMPSTTNRSPTTHARFNHICSEGELDNQTPLFNQLVCHTSKILLTSHFIF